MQEIRELINFSKEVYYTKLQNELSGPGESFTKLSYSVHLFMRLNGIYTFWMHSTTSFLLYSLLETQDKDFFPAGSTMYFPHRHVEWCIVS